MPAELVPIAPTNAMQFKAVRLAALQDSPTAFGSTYAKEAQLSEADWLDRSKKWNGDKAIGYLAMDSRSPCGIVAAFIDEHAPGKAHVVSMWVGPMHRRSGVGRSLIDAVVMWACAKSVSALHLMVTSCNDGAIEFYKRNGFAMTGKTEPYPNSPSLFEYEMSRPISKT